MSRNLEPSVERSWQSIDFWQYSISCKDKNIRIVPFIDKVYLGTQMALKIYQKQCDTQASVQENLSSGFPTKRD